jgi:hypothetical protein
LGEKVFLHFKRKEGKKGREEGREGGRVRKGGKECIKKERRRVLLYYWEVVEHLGDRA